MTKVELPIWSRIKPDNVVFAQIGARLNFDHVQRNIAGVFQAMFLAQGHKSRLVLAQ